MAEHPGSPFRPRTWSDSEDSEMFLHENGGDDQRPMFEHFYETISREMNWIKVGRIQPAPCALAYHNIGVDIDDLNPMENCPVVYEIPGGMLYGTRIDLRVRPSEDMKGFTVSLQRDIVGNPKAGVAMRVHYDIENEEEIKCLALVGDDIIETPVAPVKKEMFEDRFFVLSISTMPLRYKVYVDSIFLAEQQHFMDVQSVLYLRVDGDLLVYCAEVTDNFSSQHLLPVGRRDVEATPTKALKTVGSPGSSRSSTLDRSTLDTLPKEYQTMLSELEEQSSRIDEEIKRISQKTVQKSSAKKSKRKVSAPKADELSDDETTRKEKKKRGPEKDKTRFGKFFQKLKKPRKSFKKDKMPGQAQRVQSDSDNASELSTDFENYLMMTDSDVDSRESPTELLQEVEEQERRQKARMKDLDDDDVTGRGSDAHYDSSGAYADDEDVDYEVDRNEAVEIPFSALKEPQDQVIRIRTPAVLPEKTRLRISTQVVTEEGEVVSQTSEDMTPPKYTGVHLDSCTDGHPAEQKCACPCHFMDPSKKKYTVIHHHVHHHVDNDANQNSTDAEKVKLDGGVEAPPYSTDDPPGYTPIAVASEAKEGTSLLHKTDPSRRWRVLCCQCCGY